MDPPSVLRTLYDATPATLFIDPISAVIYSIFIFGLSLTAMAYKVAISKNL